VSLTANGATDQELRGQAEAVRAGLRPADGGVVYARGALPHESSSGELVDMAVVGLQGVTMQTTEPALSKATLRSLAGGTLRSGRPALVDFYDSDHVHRRAYVIAAATGTAAQPVAVVAS